MLLDELESIGKNVAEAIENGIKKLECGKDDVDIKILDEGSSGLFGLMGAKPARVLLTAKNKKKKENENDVKSENKIKDIDKNGETEENIDQELSCKNVQKIIEDIVKMMGIKIENIKASFKDGFVNVDVKTDNSSVLIGRAGQSLDALEYVTQLIANTNPKTRVKVYLDTDNYRLKQEERLKSIAEKAIEYVKRTKKIYRFDPMSAKDRKFIHQYFKNLGEFDTFSEGEGAMRKVGVKLSIDKN
ncbi:RNA-binding cell elongation regulator Jag/EloR [Candidatus Ruminimicrobium bovinum]|uniref:RNA-binding cell elongation regulator Jag/EloR n=1 Tax=Candidatus Ruminimicrobium bovinum TaxID=3242779 RepID=UPI0039B994C9